MAPTSAKASELSISEFKYLRISYGALVVVVGAIFGFTAWMTTINIKINEQGDAIQALKSVDTRLTRMETLLEDLKTQNNKITKELK